MIDLHQKRLESVNERRCYLWVETDIAGMWCDSMLGIVHTRKQKFTEFIQSLY